MDSEYHCTTIVDTIPLLFTTKVLFAYGFWTTIFCNKDTFTVIETILAFITDDVEVIGTTIPQMYKSELFIQIANRPPFVGIRDDGLGLMFSNKMFE